MKYKGGAKSVYTKGGCGAGGKYGKSGWNGYGGYGDCTHNHGHFGKGGKTKSATNLQTEPRQLRIPPPQAADLSVQKEALSGEMRSFDRGHHLGAAGELYFEVSGEGTVQLVIPGSTKLGTTDWEDFNVPVTLANQRFRSIQELQRRIVKIREICEFQTREGRSGRLTPDDEKLMMEVFKHHPRAAEKLKDVQYIKVGQCSKSNDPNHYTFFVMRNEEDGESISYVSCLRCLADQESGRQVTETVLSLATVSFDQHGLKVEMGGDVMALESDPSQPASVGVRVELEKKWLSLHSATREYGPYPLGKGILNGGRDNSALLLLVDASGESAISWAAPFRCFPHTPLRLPGKLPPGMARFKEETNLKRTLELLMKEAEVPGNLSSFPFEEVKRIAYQTLVRTLHTATQVQRSRKAAEAQGQGLVILAKNQAQELMQEQLMATLQKLNTSNAEQEALQAANEKLLEELAALRRQVEPIATNGERAKEDAPREFYDKGLESQNSYRSTDVHPVKKLQELNRRLRTELPHHAVSMLQGTLKLVSSEMYSGPSRAFWELLQNADDCRYEESPSIKVAYSSTYLWLEYNEVGFSDQDVEALCNLCASTKGLGQTGHKGVGFKASFVLSGKPHVLSETYKFYFDEENDCPLPQVTPEVLHDVALPREMPTKGTVIYLPLRKAFSDLLGELHPSTLLFLRRLKKITVENEEGPCRSYTYELGKSLEDQRIDSVICTRATKGKDGEDVPMTEDEKAKEEHSFFVARLPEKPKVAIAFPLTGPSSPCAAVSATLPLTTLPGLKTPLNAPFQLTANREALQDSSPENAELRDQLADLWLKTVKDAKHLGLPVLQTRAWLLLPGNELAQQRFWAPFHQKVSCGLREVPLIPVRGSEELLPMSRCRKPDSVLLKTLGLGLKDLALVNLGIPTEEYIEQLPEGSSPGFSEFDAKDLMRLLQKGSWEVKGNRWRKDVVKALAKRPYQLDLMQLSQVPLFIVADSGAGTWSKCGEGQIFSAVPKTTPNGLLKVLDAEDSCKEDKELLKLLGCGGRATHRDVGYAIVNQSMGLTVADDERFSWSNLSYVGHHWDSILNSSAADPKLSKLTCEEMERLLKTILVPECTGGVLHVPCELYTPFLLGCKPEVDIERSKLANAPPSAGGVQQRLWWERVFLRLGVQSLASSRRCFTVRLPKGLFALPKVCNEISALLEHYTTLGVLETVQRCCEIHDGAGNLRKAAHGGNDRNRLLGPKFEQYLGPNYVVEVCKQAEKLAEQLLDVILDPTADLILKLLDRAAKKGTKTWLASCKFIAEEWVQRRLSPELLDEVKAKGELWVPADGQEGKAVVKSVQKTCWPEIQSFIPPWGMRKIHKEHLKEFFISGLGLAEVAPTAPLIAPPDVMMASPAPEDPLESGGLSPLSEQFKVKNEVEDSGQSGSSGTAIATVVVRGGVSLSSRRADVSGGAGHGSAGPFGGTKRPVEGASLVDLRPSKVKKETERASQLLPLPRLREKELEENPFADQGDSDVGAALPTLHPGSAGTGGFMTQFPPLPMVAKLLLEIYHQNGGMERLHGEDQEYCDMSIAKIRFTQNSVSAKFAHGALKGRRLIDVAADLRKGKLRASELPLSVVKHGDHFWTLNNRSLYVLNAASRHRDPLDARARTFQLCPVTAKFLQLRCGSMLEEPTEAPEVDSEGEKEPEFDEQDEQMLEQGTAAVVP